MEIGLWILSFCLMAIETCGSIYFFDTFMERKRTGRLEKRGFVVLYPAMVAVAFLGEYCPMGVFLQCEECGEVTQIDFIEK